MYSNRSKKIKYQSYKRIVYLWRYLLLMLEKQIIAEAEYRYIELGKGTPVVILHGLMGGLSNFEG